MSRLPRLTLRKGVGFPRSYGTRPRVAIVGSGPAGFYTAHQLIKRHKEIRVDIFESLPIPFGLVRYGVAPDHPEVKNVINQFTTLAQSDQCCFFGNVHFGRDITLNQLKPLYNAIVLAYGAEDDKLMGIPGEDLRGVHSARAFVGWYNGVPDHANLDPDLSGETAVVIGQGNVALDVARMLLAPVELLKKTDICSHAIDSLCRSNVRKVIVVGRRGPLEAAFTIKELREMIRLPQCQTVIHSKDIEEYETVIESLPRPRKRITELMIKTAVKDHIDDCCTKFWELKFLRSPFECLSAPDGCVKGITLEINKLEKADDNSIKAVGTGNYEVIDCSLVLRSIGYKSLVVDPNLPFDHKSGTLPNKSGRIIDSNGVAINGLYCSGWVKRGPTGVILNTMNDAFETADSIIKDINENKILCDAADTDVALNGLLQKQGVNPVLFDDWEKIDKEEQARGAEKGKPREKVVSIEEMLRIIKR